MMVRRVWSNAEKLLRKQCSSKGQTPRNLRSSCTVPGLVSYEGLAMLDVSGPSLTGNGPDSAGEQL